MYPTTLPYHVIFVSVVMTTISADMMFVTELTTDTEEFPPGAIYISHMDFSSPSSVGPSVEYEALPLADVGNPLAVDFDPDSGQVYWLDFMTQTIVRANLNGTSRQVVLSGMLECTGFVLDPTSNVLYWTDEGNRNIGTANMNGSEPTIIVDSLELKPRPIVLDSHLGHIYWAEYDETPDGEGGVGKIQRALSDGTNMTTIIQSDLEYPNGLAVDSQAGFLYWCDAGTNRLEKADLSGQNRVVLFSTHVDIYPFAIALHMDYLYWTDWSSAKLTQIHVDNDETPHINNGGPIGQAIFNRASGIHIHKESPMEFITDEPDNPKTPYVTNAHPRRTTSATGITGLVGKTNATDMMSVSPSMSTSSNEDFTKRLHLIITLPVWTMLFIIIIVMITIAYHKISCRPTEKIKSLYESTVYKTDDMQSSLEDYYTISESKPTNDYATKIQYKMADEDSGFHQQDNPAYITTTGQVAVVGLQPRYDNLSPPVKDGITKEDMEFMDDEVGNEIPPEPPSVGKLNEVVKSQKI